jgi:hypothetical protein
MAWGGRDIRAWKEGRRKLFAYDLDLSAPAVHLGRFVLGSMRIERAPIKRRGRKSTAISTRLSSTRR